MSDVLDSAAAAYLRVESLLINSNRPQWEAGMSPVLREDTTERSKGMTSDPTPTIAGDPRRLKLREARKEALIAQASLLRVMHAAIQHLERAIAEAKD